MKDKIEQIKPNDAQINKSSSSPVITLAKYTPAVAKYVPSLSQVHDYAWKTANFTAIALATSVSVVAVQSPFRTILLNISKSGSALPTGYNGGILGLVKTLYAGTGASLSGSAVRSAYVTGAKNTKPIEGSVIKEEGQIQDEKLFKEEGPAPKKSHAQLGRVASLALGDIFVSNISESLSQLRKVPGMLPDDFKWTRPHNTLRLMAGGFTPRYLAGMVNFASLCLLEESLASKLPFENKKMAHFTSGAISGMTAAFFSFPFTAMKDYTLVHATVNNGLLYNKSSLALMKELSSTFIASPEASLKSFGTMALKQLPIRVGLTGVIFALVAGVGETLGNEPLKNVVSEKYQPSSAAKSRYSLFASPKEDPRLIENAPNKEAPLLIEKTPSDESSAQSRL